MNLTRPALPETGFVRLPQILSLIPISRSAWWAGIREGKFPQGIERRRETNDRQREPVLLRGLLFTSDGERLVPSYTVKKGKTYRYYSPIKHRRFGAWAS